MGLKRFSSLKNIFLDFGNYFYFFWIHEILPNIYLIKLRGPLANVKLYTPQLFLKYKKVIS